MCLQCCWGQDAFHQEVCFLMCNEENYRKELNVEVFSHFYNLQPFISVLPNQNFALLLAFHSAD